MAERPMIFSGLMVRALLAGTKTQTRRLIRPQPVIAELFDPDDDPLVDDGEEHWIIEGGRLDRRSAWPVGAPPFLPKVTPYGAPGDRLWVRETWTPADRLVDGYERDDPTLVGYRADGTVLRWEGIGLGGVTAPQKLTGWDADDLDGIRWRPSIFMPRWASRLTLEVTQVRVQRLQEISEEDARAEGCDATGCWEHRHDAEHSCLDARIVAYCRLWDQINAKRAPWASNPWVWALTFKAVT